MTKKGKQRASADVGLMFTVYNLRRLISILGRKTLGEYLKKLLLSILKNIRLISIQIKAFKQLFTNSTTCPDASGYFSSKPNKPQIALYLSKF